MHDDLIKRLRSAAQHSREFGPIFNAELLDAAADALSRAEADARRYRLIRDCAPEVFDEFCASLYSGGEEMDAAIDAAMGGGEELK